MKVLVINYDSFYEEEVVGVALNMDAAKRYIKILKEQYPYLYEDKFGKFYYDEYEVIEE